MELSSHALLGTENSYKLLQVKLRHACAAQRSQTVDNSVNMCIKGIVAWLIEWYGSAYIRLY